MYATSEKKTVHICKADDKVIKKGCDNILNKRVQNMIKLSEERDTKNVMTNLPLVFFLTITTCWLSLQLLT